MDTIIQWITQIILFIILATMIDLIIPSSSMKKYIKLVVGLILILILLKPIFYIANINVNHALNSAFNQFNSELNKEQSLKNSIEFQKREIQSKQDAYILEQMAVQLIDIARDPLEKQHDLEITDIQFRFHSEQNYTYEDLNEVIVYVQEFDEGEGERSLVQDVAINTDERIDNKEVDRHESEIKQLLEQVWELPDKNISIYWEGGSS